MDEPLADSSLLPTWFLFQEIQKQGIRCVLSGDGADELFAGYPTYVPHKYLPSSFRIPDRFSHWIQKLPSSSKGVSWDYMLKRYSQSHQKEWWKRHQLWNGAWFPEELQAGEDIWNIAEEYALRSGSDRVGRAMFLDQRLYLAEGVLSKVDRASMAHGIEVRSPFLDQHIVRMAAEIPMQFKLNRHGSKQILRSLFPALPTSIRQRPKKGFGSPIAQWLRSDFDYLLDGLDQDLAEWIDPELLRRIRSEHLSGKVDHRRRLWTAISLKNWLQRN